MIDFPWPFWLLLVVFIALLYAATVNVLLRARWRKLAQAGLLSRNTEPSHARSDMTPLLQQQNQELTQRNAEQLALIEQERMERRQLELILQRTQQQLEHALSALNAKTREITLLREMAEFLETSGDQEDMLVTLTHFLPYMFKNTCGALYLQNTGEMRRELTWGENAASLTELFDSVDCWAVRRNHSFEGTAHSAVSCRHALTADGQAPHYLCVPVFCSGEIAGVLHIQPVTADGPLYQSLAAGVVEHIGLLLSNLKLREYLSHQAFHDPLTQVFNRRCLDDMLPREIQRARRGARQLGLVLLDIDHFKRFNDQYGHAAGDAVLVALAGLLRNHLRGSDVVCRYGGEEFLLLLPDSELEGACLRLEELRVHVQSLQVFHESQALPTITLSMGLALYPIHGEQAIELTAAADEALYRAKNAGRNRVCVATLAAQPSTAESSSNDTGHV